MTATDRPSTDLTPNPLTTATELEDLPDGAVVVDGRGRAAIAATQSSRNGFTGVVTSQRVFVSGVDWNRMPLDVLDDGPAALIHLPQYGGPFIVTRNDHGHGLNVVDTRDRRPVAIHTPERFAERTATHLNLEARQ